MTIFRTYGGRQIIRDAAAIQQFPQLVYDIDGFNIVHENGAYVLDTKTNLSSSEQHVQPMISNKKLERALSQAAKEHKSKRAPWRPTRLSKPRWSATTNHQRWNVRGT